jgi:hypothetical protein
MKVKLILKRAILIIAVLAVIGWFIWQIPAAKTILTTPNFWTFDVASGVAIGFTGWAVYLQRKQLEESIKELALQREQIALNRKELEGQKEQTRRLADLTEQTAKATRLQTEIEFCKKIECRMVHLYTTTDNIDNPSKPYEIHLAQFMSNVQRHGLGKKSYSYQSLYEQLKDYLKPDSQLYNYYLAEDSAFTILYEKCKEVTKSQ